MLNENTLVKVTASEDRISFRTVSRSYKSPHRFVILRSALKRLADESCMVSDLSSFASLWHVQGTNDLHIWRFRCCAGGWFAFCAIIFTGGMEAKFDFSMTVIRSASPFGSICQEERVCAAASSCTEKKT